mgnify:CR=1 FL=1
MSSLKKNIVGSQLPAPPPSDYVPQHPLYAFKPKPVAAKDHLDNYVETRPFEDTEGLLSWAKGKLSTRKKKKLEALRVKLRLLCTKTKHDDCGKIETMNLKQLKALKKKLKPKKGSSNWAIWRFIDEGLTGLTGVV